MCRRCIRTLARRMCYGSSFSEKLRRCSWVPFRVSSGRLPLLSHLKDKVDQNYRAPARFSPFPGFGRSRKLATFTNRHTSSSAKDATAPISVRARGLNSMFLFNLFNSFRWLTTSAWVTPLGTQEELPPRCHQLPQVIRFSTSKTPERRSATFRGSGFGFFSFSFFFF